MQAAVAVHARGTDQDQGHQDEFDADHAAQAYDLGGRGAPVRLVAQATTPAQEAQGRHDRQQGRQHEAAELGVNQGLCR